MQFVPFKKIKIENCTLNTINFDCPKMEFGSNISLRKHPKLRPAELVSLDSQSMLTVFTAVFLAVCLSLDPMR